MKIIVLAFLVVVLGLFIETEKSEAVPIEGSCVADYTGDRWVTLADVVTVGPSFNTLEGNPLYHPRFDLNNSHSITLADIVLIGPFFNQPCSGGDYVESFGKTLYTPSNPNYKFTGVNRYNFLTNDPAGSSWLGCGGTWTEAQIETVLTELEAQGVNSIRLWTFQKFIFEGTTPSWTRFEYVLGRADAHGIKVMPVLENQWDDNAPATVTDCTEGGFKRESWYQSGYLVPDDDGVGSGHAFSLKEYVDIIVTRYKDDERILMWQIMNEAEIKTDSGSCGSAIIFRNMADDIATDIQAIDSNHLVSFGTLGAGQCGAQGADYKTLHALTSIDVCEYHDYGHPTESIPTGGNLLSTRLTQCSELNKPIFIGEAGIKSTDYTLQQRADLFDAKIGAFYGSGGVGYLIWSYRDRDFAHAPWDYDSADPLAQVVSSY